MEGLSRSLTAPHDRIRVPHTKQHHRFTCTMQVDSNRLTFSLSPSIQSLIQTFNQSRRHHSRVVLYWSRHGALFGCMSHSCACALPSREKEPLLISFTVSCPCYEHHPARFHDQSSRNYSSRNIRLTCSATLNVVPKERSWQYNLASRSVVSLCATNVRRSSRCSAHWLASSILTERHRYAYLYSGIYRCS